MLNLATNAVQHTGPGDRLGSGSTRRPTLRGSGCVTPARASSDDVIDQLFTRRFRGAASRAQRSDGMGIGLSIVDAIARGHGGRASAANEPGGGARFTIELPLDPPPEDLP
jgi:two-component system, OmpR family, sensor kinase